MDIAPAILRLKPEPDASQQQVIGHIEGPILVIAGPGSGKTGSIQLRAVNLLLTGRAKPSEAGALHLRPGRGPAATAALHLVGAGVRGAGGLLPE